MSPTNLRTPTVRSNADYYNMDGRRIDKVLAQRIGEQGVLETQSLPAH